MRQPSSFSNAILVPSPAFAQSQALRLGRPGCSVLASRQSTWVSLPGILTNMQVRGAPGRDIRSFAKGTPSALWKTTEFIPGSARAQINVSRAGMSRFNARVAICRRNTP